MGSICVERRAYSLTLRVLTHCCHHSHPTPKQVQHDGEYVGNRSFSGAEDDAAGCRSRGSGSCCVCRLFMQRGCVKCRFVFMFFFPMRRAWCARARGGLLVRSDFDALRWRIISLDNTRFFALVAGILLCLVHCVIIGGL